MTRQRPDVVAVVQPFVPTYRVPFFDALDAELERRGLKLEVWHDQPKGRVAARGNASRGRWSVPIRQRRVSIAGKNVTFRNVGKGARQVGLVVAGLASGNVETYGLALDPRVRLTLWGHGRNFTADNNRLDGALEKWLIGRSKQVFVYTPAGARHLRDSGVADDMLTVVMNSTDTRAITTARSRATPEEIADARRTWGITGERVGLFVGAYDDSKRLPFLFEAADLVHEADPGFELVIAGAGPLVDWVTAEARARPYVRLLPRIGPAELGVLGHVANVILMPGRIGLVAADSLAMGVPVVTARHAFHAPEAEYLDDDVSLWTVEETTSYARETVALLADQNRLRAMQDACLARADDLSSESAAARFAEGIDAALDKVADR